MDTALRTCYRRQKVTQQTWSNGTPKATHAPPAASGGLLHGYLHFFRLDIPSQLGSQVEGGPSILFVSYALLVPFDVSNLPKVGQYVNPWLEVSHLIHNILV
jgi:hypothetical protein